MKGGVGKTTVTAHLIEALCRAKAKKALVLDLDPQFNLTQLLLSEEDYDQAVDAGQTIGRVFEPTQHASLFDVVETPIPPPAHGDIALPLADNETYSYDLIPGSMDLVRYGLVKEQDALGAVASRFARFVGQAKSDYDGIFIDCNPSASFLSRCALDSADRILVPVRPDKYSYIGLSHVDKVLEMMPEVVQRPEFDIVLNGVAAGEIPQTERELRKSGSYGEDVLVAKIPKSAHLEAKPERTGFLSTGQGPWIEERRQEVRQVAEEYGGRIGW